jgi:hypothetical protein
MKKRIYIAGPMRGIPDYNFPAFDAAADCLERAGWEVVNPAQIDRELGFDPEDMLADHDWDQVPDGMDLRRIANRDLIELLTCDAIHLLDGWETSLGACAERAVAHWVGVEVYKAGKAAPVVEDVKSVCAEADGLVSGERRATYGHPKQNFARTAKIWSGILNYTVTAEQVGLCMMGLKLAREAHLHKRDNLVDLCGYAKTVELCHE